MENEQEWEQCENCDSSGQIDNMTYDPDHDCRFGYDCDCEDAEPYFICEKCDGDGWVEKPND